MLDQARSAQGKSDPRLSATFFLACARSLSRSSLGLAVHVSAKSRCFSTRGFPTESSLGWLVLSVWLIILCVACHWLNSSKTSLRKLGTSAKVLSHPDMYNCRRLTWTLAEDSLKVTCPQNLGLHNTWLLISKCACDLLPTVVCLTRDGDTGGSIKLRRLARRVDWLLICEKSQTNRVFEYSNIRCDSPQIQDSSWVRAVLLACKTIHLYDRSFLEAQACVSLALVT